MRTLGQKIKFFRKNGLNYLQIQEILGCSRSNISYHLNEKTKTDVYKRTVKRRRLTMPTTDLIKIERGSACEACGFDADLGALQFHHRDPKKKKFALSRAPRGAYAKVKAEANKCALVCGNCHVLIHAGKLDCP
jgi:hypothetical protein